MKEVKFRNKKFRVIPENKKVFGSMRFKYMDDYEDFSEIDEEHRYTLIRAIEAYLYNDDLLYNCPDIKATAICSEHDEFNEETGIHVCAAKLEQKNHMKIAKYYDRAHRLFIECANIAYKLCEKHFRKAQAIEEDMINYYGRKPE